MIVHRNSRRRRRRMQVRSSLTQMRYWRSTCRACQARTQPIKHSAAETPNHPRTTWMTDAKPADINTNAGCDFPSVGCTSRLARLHPRFSGSLVQLVPATRALPLCDLPAYDHRFDRSRTYHDELSSDTGSQQTSPTFIVSAFDSDATTRANTSPTYPSREIRKDRCREQARESCQYQNAPYEQVLAVSSSSRDVAPSGQPAPFSPHPLAHNDRCP